MIMARATADDVDTLLAWRHQRRAELEAQGSDQWSIAMPRAEFAATVASGQTWVARDGDEPAGTITLSAWSEVNALWRPPSERGTPLWYPQDRPNDALYFARMIVPRSRAGQGLGREMMAWAGGRAYDAGLIWLRCDAWTTNHQLHRYYLERGFSHVRTLNTLLSGACFQRVAQPYTGRLKTEGD